MLSLLKLVLASSLILMSDRENFWTADDLSDRTEELANGKVTPVSFDELTGKRVLLLVHGYNSTSDGALDHYQTIQKNLDPFDLYDTMIGYFWPGCDLGLEYYAAEKNTQKLAPRMHAYLETLSDTAAHLDVLAHSMGNRLILEALQLSNKPTPIVRNFYSLAAAVKDKDIEMGHPFYQAALQSRNLFIFHSDRDDVLKYDFLVAERSEALGYGGLDKASKEPKNIQFVDCTQFVNGHSGYFEKDAMPLYIFLKNQQIGQITSAINVELLSDGFTAPK